MIRLHNRRNRLLSFLLLGLTGASISARCPAQNPPIGKVQLQWQGEQVVAETWIGGQGPYRFSIDTGASGSGRIDLRVAEELGLVDEGSVVNRDGAGGSSERRVIRAPDFRVGELEFGTVELLVGDYSWVGKTDPIDGIIGYDLLKQRVVVIDYPKLQLELREEELTDGPDVFDFPNRHGLPIVPLKIGSEEGVGLLDTGNDSALSMPSAFLEVLKMADDPTPAGRAKTAEQEFPIQAATLVDPVEIGAVAVEGVRAMFGDAWRFPIVGSVILRDYRITIDHARGRMSLRKQER